MLNLKIVLSCSSCLQMFSWDWHWCSTKSLPGIDKQAENNSGGHFAIDVMCLSQKLRKLEKIVQWWLLWCQALESLPLLFRFILNSFWNQALTAIPLFFHLFHRPIHFSGPTCFHLLAIGHMWQLSYSNEWSCFFTIFLCLIFISGQETEWTQAAMKATKGWVTHFEPQTWDFFHQVSALLNTSNLVEARMRTKRLSHGSSLFSSPKKEQAKKCDISIERRNMPVAFLQWRVEHDRLSLQPKLVD